MLATLLIAINATAGN